MADADQADFQGRAFWSGTLTFGLVSIPVELYSVVRPRRAALRMFSPAGRPLVRRYTCNEDQGRQKLEGDDLVRGYELAEGEYVIVTDEELAAVEPKKSRDIELRRFVKREDIDPAYFERPYLMAPAGSSTKAYHLLAHTLEARRRCGVATFVMRGREHLTAIEARNGLLWAAILRFAAELRSPQDVGLLPPPPAPRAVIEAFEEALGVLQEEQLNVALLDDEESQQLLELAERKRARHQDVIRLSDGLAVDEEGGMPGNVVDIMQLLKERLGQVASPASRAPSDERNEAPRPETRAARSAPVEAHRAESETPSKSAPNSGQSKQQLYARAKALGISGRSKMSKQDLLRAVRRAS